MRTQQVECIVFRRTDKIEFLLLKRIPKKGAFWQPPCGGVEETDKSLLDACYREIKEETGIDKNQIINVIEKVHEFTINNDYLTGEKAPPLTEYAYGFEVKPDTVVKLDLNIYPEHEEYKWLVIDEAIKYLKWQDNKNAFTALNKVLQENN